jgi:hypothetical protein
MSTGSPGTKGVTEKQFRSERSPGGAKAVARTEVAHKAASTRKPSRKLRTFTPPPTLHPDDVQQATEVAESVADRLANRVVPLRWSFVWRIDSDSPDPAAIRLLRRSEISLKAMLTLYWVCGGGVGRRRGYQFSDREVLALAQRGANGLPIVQDGTRGRARLVGTDPHSTVIDFREWGVILGRSGTGEVAATSSIGRALDALGAEGLVLQDRERRCPPRLQVGLETGTPSQFRVYKPPPRGKKSQGPFDASDAYFPLPPELWTNGWMATLSGKALITYLVLQRQLKIRERSIPLREAFLVDHRRVQHYAIGDEAVVGKGAAELEYYGMLTRIEARSGRHEYRMAEQPFQESAIAVMAEAQIAPPPRPRKKRAQ